MFKTNLDFANLCLYRELEISCCFIFGEVWELFFVAARAIKIKITIVLNFFCCSIYILQHYAHHRNHNCYAFCQLRKVFFRCFYMKEQHWLCPTEFIPHLPKTALPTAHSFITKSNDGTGYCTPCFVCKREKFDQFNTSLKYVYIHIIFFSVTNSNKISISTDLPTLKCLGHVFGRFDYIHLKLFKFSGFRFLVTEDTKCHICIFSIFLNLSLPLVICTAEKAILANTTQNERRTHARWTMEIGFEK